MVTPPGQAGVKRAGAIAPITGFADLYPMRMRLLGPLALVLIGGCATDPLNEGDINDSEVYTLVNQMVRIGLTAVAGHAPQSAGAATATAAAPNGQVNFPVNYTQGCIEAGRAVVTGSVSGILNDFSGDGTLAVDAHEALENCTMSVADRQFVINGTLNLDGTYVYSEGGPAAEQGARIRGDFTFTSTPGGPGRCHLDLVTAYNTATALVAVAGTACGRAVSF